MPTKPVDVVIYVRHAAGCKYAGDEYARRCTCRKHLRWNIEGKRYRKKAGTRSWTEAEEVRRTLADQLAGRTAESVAEALIQEAVGVFLTDKEVQGVTPDVLAKYKREMGRFRVFCEGRGAFAVAAISRELLTAYAATWTRYESTQTRNAVRTRLRGFLRYCYEAQWLPRVPTLPKITMTESPTLPLTNDEYCRLLAAISVVTPNTIAVAEHTRFHAGRTEKTRALVLLMRYSGLAIQDAATLPRTSLFHDARRGLYRVVTKRQKTGTHVSVAIPADVAREILAAGDANGNAYLFWTGVGTPRTAVSHWQTTFRKLFAEARIPSGGSMMSHRLRDTFAVDLLEKGVPLEEVSKALGHESIKTTERSYSKWVRGRQDRLDDFVIGTWTDDAEKPHTVVAGGV